MRFALNTPSNADQEQLKFNQRLVDKLKYCKEVLVSIKNASATGVVEDAQDGGMDVERPLAQQQPQQQAKEGRGEQPVRQQATGTLGRSRQAGSKMSLR